MYMAVNLIKAIVHCSMVYIFLRFRLGTRLIVDFASSCKEKLVFVDVVNVVLGSKEPKSLYWFFSKFSFLFYLRLAEKLLWIWAPHIVVELNLCLYLVMTYIAIPQNFGPKC